MRGMPIDPDLTATIDKNRAKADAQLDQIITVIRDGIAESGLNYALGELALLLQHLRPESVAGLALTALGRLATQPEALHD